MRDHPDYVLAIFNRGEHHFVAEGEAELHDRIDAEGEIEVDADQCDSCGSFAENGEPGRGFIVRRRDPKEPLRGTAAFCGCCGNERQIRIAEAAETVF